MTKTLLTAGAAMAALVGSAHAATVAGTIAIDGSLDRFGNAVASTCSFTGSDVDQDAGAGEAYSLTGECSTSVENNNTIVTSVSIDLTASEDGTMGGLTVSGVGGPLAIVNGNDVLEFSASLPMLGGTGPFGLQALLAAFDDLGTTVVATVDNPQFPQVAASVVFDVDVAPVPLPGAALLFMGGAAAIGAARKARG